MNLSAKMITALLIGLGLTAAGSFASSKTMQEATTPGDSNGQAAAAPNPDASGTYHLAKGNGVSAPQLVYSVDAEYSDKARRKKLSGVCVLSMVVDESGTPQDVQVVSSIESSVAPKLRSAARGLDENAIKAARQYRFKPGTYEGKPVPVELKMEISYRIY